MQQLRARCAGANPEQLRLDGTGRDGPREQRVKGAFFWVAVAAIARMQDPHAGLVVHAHAAACEKASFVGGDAQPAD